MLLTTSAAFVHPALQELKRSGPGPLGHPGSEGWRSNASRGGCRVAGAAAHAPGPQLRMAGGRPSPKSAALGIRGRRWAAWWAIAHMCVNSRAATTPPVARPTRYLRACCTELSATDQRKGPDQAPPHPARRIPSPASHPSSGRAPARPRQPAHRIKHLAFPPP